MICADILPSLNEHKLKGGFFKKKKSVHALVLSKDRLGTIEIDVPRGVYPKKALLMGQEGTVKARVVFDSSGRVSSIHWLQVSSFNELNRAAESLIRQARLSGNLQSSVEQQLPQKFKVQNSGEQQLPKKFKVQSSPKQQL